MHNSGIGRREFLQGLALLTGGTAGLAWIFGSPRQKTETFIAKVNNYHEEIASVIRRGLLELGVSPGEVNGKKILLKPNLVEVIAGAEHINTHPLLVRGAAEAFLGLGARQVIIGEGPGHCRDTLYVVESSGLAEILVEDRIPFVDLNNDRLITRRNPGNRTNLKALYLPTTLEQVDWIVSLAKMKTHHWTGATLSMKNLFGVMPGIAYGWPKNVLHQEGIEKSIFDINATVKPHFAIVDGIIGMEGDGPIMGTAKQAGVIVMGRNLPSVDATCCRIMGIDPFKVQYLLMAAKWLGPVNEDLIEQRGETIKATSNPFMLLENIPAQRKLL